MNPERCPARAWRDGIASWGEISGLREFARCNWSRWSLSSDIGWRPSITKMLHQIVSVNLSRPWPARFRTGERRVVSKSHCASTMTPWLLLIGVVWRVTYTISQMLSRITRLPLRRCLHTGAPAANSASSFGRTAKIIAGISVLSTAYLTWRLRESHHIALDSSSSSHSCASRKTSYQEYHG